MGDRKGLYKAVGNCDLIVAIDDETITLECGEVLKKPDRDVLQHRPKEGRRPMQIGDYFAEIWEGINVDTDDPYIRILSPEVFKQWFYKRV